MTRINYVSTNGPGGPVQVVGGGLAQASDYGYVEIGRDGLNAPGSFPFRVDQSGNISSGGTRLPVLQATTGINGIALVNGTPNILTWTAPNDGQMHRVQLIAQVNVTSLETGGQVTLQFTDLTSTLQSRQMIAGGQAAGFSPLTSENAFLVKPGTTVFLTQTALTGGAATIWAELWGS
jgi:hypothetical protein